MISKWLPRVIKSRPYENVARLKTTQVYSCNRYDPETKRQSSQWLEPGEPRFKKERMIKSKLKCLLITFFDVKGLVHYEFVPEGQTINQHYYIDVLRRLREAVRQKRPEKWHQKNWLLNQDNARPHTAVTVQLYLDKTRNLVYYYPSYPILLTLLPTTFSFTLKFKKSKRTSI
ncbi:hypothetical protein LAZ67_15001822 [Cordylochernes scorpioides]|uniref:Transposase n=1 Tax=Cordylochernes scorpioides TaxID=51811 RepID=A0ABY6L922_9ARAC|nr:hypothetical protein LAZ67_15001822 [Cordylochernes scorpioides]